VKSGGVECRGEREAAAKGGRQAVRKERRKKPR